MFLFLDTESSGLSKTFSQVYEIAMIATDAELNMMSSLHTDCARLPWNIPGPGALLITGITPDQLKNNPRGHYEMMQEVNDYVDGQNWPVVFAGYNILGYDQAVLAQNLHQTLYDPFVMTACKDWQAEPNNVFDVFELVKAVHIYAPSVLKLDIKTKTGKPSMALGNVARQNDIDLSEEDAHGAFSDTKATIDLAKKLKQEAPQIWDQMLKMSNSKKVEAFLQDNEVFAYSQCPYGAAHSVIGTRLSDVEDSKTEALIWDLNVDPAEYADASDEKLTKMLRSWGRVRFQQPIQPIRKHKQPILMPVDQADVVWPQGLTKQEVAQRVQYLKENPDFAQRVAHLAKQAQKSFPPGVEPEQQMYEKPDCKVQLMLENWKERFHKADWEEKLKLTEELKQRLASDIRKTPSLKRFVTFAQRLIYANAPELLTEAQQEKIGASLHNRRVSSEKTPYMTIPKARAELKQIERERAEGLDKWKHVTDSDIRSLKLYYTALEKEFSHLSGKKAAVNNDALNAAPSKAKRKQSPKSR